MSFFYPKSTGNAKTEVKGSRFIGSLEHVANTTEAEEKIRQIKAKFSDASHNCFAYRVLNPDGSEYHRFSDEGEPSGTAGKPIFDSLIEKNIMEALLVVSRYFGGTKLGIGGLNRAYRECARSTVADSRLEEKVESKRFLLRFDYQHEPHIKNLLFRMNGTIESSQFKEDVEYSAALPSDISDEFLLKANDICRGQFKYELIREEL